MAGKIVRDINRFGPRVVRITVAGKKQPQKAVKNALDLSRSGNAKVVFTGEKPAVSDVKPRKTPPGEVFFLEIEAEKKVHGQQPE